ncbi:ImcF-related family protein [Pantoea agglomerans]|uniref:Type VI secretion protein VasK n=1 Tax=Enterobacter agglomerans TaxID=549 RepID=A0ACC5RPF2_ENTAG|nr:ImcF-related family protein [Pantoea agglomerans]MBK4726473.1 type VI secretion protein VasK [Pantoea agglomerans]
MDKVNKPAAFSVAATATVCIAAVTLLVLLGGLGWWLWGTERATEWDALRPLIAACFIVWGMALSLLVLGFMAFRLLIKDNVGASATRKPKPVAPGVRDVLHAPLKTHLHSRYGLFWRYKVRLLLVVGDDAARDILLPGLRENHWLEGSRTVLIDGGSLNGAPDAEKFAALRTLRRCRPLDGIIRVLGAEQSLTPQQSDADLRALESIGTLLRYQPPVWLWQLCHSDWSQAGRTEQAVGATFPPRAQPQDIASQLNGLLPPLREMGMAQIAQSLSHDFLLRLGQRLAQGGSERWQEQLTPWLHAAQRRIVLRGLMFSLPQSGAGASGDTAALPPHALTLPATWQGVVEDCTRLRGRRVGLPWQQTLARALMAALGLWGAGMLLSFALNRQQIVSVAEQARALVQAPEVSDRQLADLHALRNGAGLLKHREQDGTPWYQRFGLDHTTPLLDAVMPWYGVANTRLIRDPAAAALHRALRALADLPPDSPQRAAGAKAGYDRLKAWLMMARPDRVDGAFYAQVMKTVEPSRDGISPGLWQALAPDLWAFYISELPHRPQWAITPDAALVSQSRQLLLQQVGRRNAEGTLYQAVLQSVRRSFADLTLEDMTAGTDARRLFTTEAVVPGMFTRQAWEGGVQQAIEKAARSRREEIDWVLSDGRQPAPADLSPEALKARLTARYFTDFAGGWLNFLNGLRLNPVDNVADVTDQLTLMSDVRQSPLIALMNQLAWQGQAGQKSEALSDTLIKSAQALTGSGQKPVIDQSASGPQGPLDATFGPLLSLTGRHSAASGDDGLSLQTYLTRLTRVRLRLQQVAGSADPQERMQALAQTVFKGNSVDLTDTRQYGSLMAASLGEEWSGFGQTVFVQPLTRAWETVLQPSAASLNAKWSRSVVTPWRSAFDGRYPFAASDNEASLPMLAEFLRKDSGRIERFLNAELGGVLHKEGSRWVPDSTSSQGLTFNPAFLRALNQLSGLSDVLFTDGQQGIRFELQARPAPGVVQTQLTVDGQTLRYFNQMAEWRTFRWPGETFRPGTMLTWSTAAAGARLFGDWSGTWGLIRWLEQGKRRQLDGGRWMMSFAAPDGRTLQWVLRSQLGSGPLELLQLRNFTLPADIFSVDATMAAQALSGNDAMPAMEGGDE